MEKLTLDFTYNQSQDFLPQMQEFTARYKEHVEHLFTIAVQMKYRIEKQEEDLRVLAARKQFRIIQP